MSEDISLWIAIPCAVVAGGLAVAIALAVRHWMAVKPSVWRSGIVIVGSLVLLSLSWPHSSLMILGSIMNFAVLLCNGGYMPVIGKVGKSRHPIWVKADREKHRLLWLADRHHWKGMSPGDFFIIGGLAIGSVWRYAFRRLGGTGIHAGLKIPRRKACGFDSRRRHQKELMVEQCTAKNRSGWSFRQKA